MDVSSYYRYQAEARGHGSVDGVIRDAGNKARIYQSLVAPWLPPSREARIYEVACGAGIVLRWLTELGYTNIEGSDSAEVQIELAHALGLPAKLADSLGELRAMPSATVDCIIGLDFYEHLPKELLLDFLAEAHRVLTPGGRLILRGPNGASPVVGCALYNDITHQWALTPTAFRATLKMIGFQEVAFKDDVLASIEHQRWLKVPLAFCAQLIVRGFLWAATREQVRCLSASIFLCAWK
jgi:2-polyprenyl-3-methyl-5-hydroxy-6-metoxy-1,4-benzoquinol methylase